ncbi:MAG: peptide-methionine (S)-S-oxide reductase MsrA, partial [Candidatus Limnocylindrales bacterium]
MSASTMEAHFVTGSPLAGPYPDGSEIAEFGMGCFWGAERIFWQVSGVIVTAAGYQGGDAPNPTYQEVCTGRTSHTEVVRVVYDPARVPYAALLRIFWENHDPTQRRRHADEASMQYRSLNFTHGDAQQRAAERSRAAYELPPLPLLRRRRAPHRPDITVYASDRKRASGQLSHERPEVLRWALFEAALAAARPTSPDHAYYLEVKGRIDHNRACLSVARKLCRR